MRLHIVLVLLGLFTSAAGSCVAQQKGESTCLSSTVYENHNQVDYGPLKVRAVRGTGIVEVGDKTQPGRAVPGACLSLFTEKKHKFLASVVADSKGQFRFDAVPPGRYRLVARANAFCVANIPLEVVRSSRKKAEILVHFRPGGIDTCSYGDLAVSKRDGSSPALLILNRVPLRTPTIPTQTAPPQTPSPGSSLARSMRAASAPVCNMTPSTASPRRTTRMERPQPASTSIRPLPMG